MTRAVAFNTQAIFSREAATQNSLGRSPRMPQNKRSSAEGAAQHSRRLDLQRQTHGLVLLFLSRLQR